MDIKHIAYEKYRLDWMLQHGYTLSDLIDVLSELQKEDPSMSLYECLDDLELITGFKGVVWVCYPEFLNNEYQDEEYMKQLLTKSEYEEYIKEN